MKKFGGFVLPYSICPYCSRRSYSAADLKIWVCPYCGKEIVEKERSEKKEHEKEEQGT
ncbi:MAG: hypothetical protein L5655_09320 [Thermosediminibacteraceae bacterium]|nr:hypothetical protein [Thermosediminibacteraceae bacterium]